MGQFKDPELALAKEVILQAQAQTTKWVTMTLVLSCVGVLGVTGIMMGVYLSGNLGKGDDSDDSVNLPVLSQAMKGANLESDVSQNHLDLSLSDPIKAPNPLHSTTPHSDDDDDQNSLSNLNKLNAEQDDKGFLASQLHHLNMIGKEMLMLPHLTRKPNAKPIILPPPATKEDITTSLPVEKLTVPAKTAPMPNAVTFDTTIRDFTISSNINSITNNFLGDVRDTLHESFFQQLSPNNYDDNSYEFNSQEKTKISEEDSDQEVSVEDNKSEETTVRETPGTDKDESSSKDQVNSGIISSETQIDEQSSTENADDKSSSEEQTADDSTGEDTVVNNILATDSKSSENQSKDEQLEASKEKDSSSEEDSNEKEISKESNDNSDMYEGKDISTQDNAGSNEVEIIKQAELDYDDSYEFEHILTDEKFKSFVATSLTLPEKMKSTETSESSAISVENDKISSHDSYDSAEQNSAGKIEIEGKDANADTSNSYEFNSAEASNSGDHSPEIAIAVLENRNSKQRDSETIDSENVSHKVKLSLGNKHGRYSYEEISSKSASDESVATEQTNDKNQHDSAESTIENKSDESENSSEELKVNSKENDKQESRIIQDDTSSESNEDSDSMENASKKESIETVSNSKSEKSSETVENKESNEVSTLTETSKSDEDSSIEVNSNENSIAKSDISHDEHSDSADKSSLINSESEESKEDSEQDSKENSRDNVDNSSNDHSSDDSNNDEQTEESSQHFEQTSKQSESVDSSLLNMGMKGTDDSSEENSSNKESTEDIDDNSKAGGTSIENLGKDATESETSESSNNDDTSTKSGEDSMINMMLNIENKSSNDKSQLDDSDENDNNVDSESNESVFSDLIATAQQIQSSFLESNEKGNEGSSEESTVISGGQNFKLNSNEFSSNQSEKDESEESEDSEKKSNERSESVNDKHSEEDNSSQHSEHNESSQHSEQDDSSQHSEHNESSQHSEQDESSQHLEQDESSQHSEHSESSQHSNQDDSSQHSEQDESSQHSEQDNSSEHSEHDDSSQHSNQDDSEQDETSQHSEQDETSQHSEQDDSSQHSEQDDSSQHSEKDESRQRSEQDDSSQHSEQDESSQHSEQDESSQHSEHNESSQNSDQKTSNQLLTQDKSNQYSEQNDSSQDSKQDDSSEGSAKSTENMASNLLELNEHNEKDESSKEKTDEEGKEDDLSDETSDESNNSMNPDGSVSKENTMISSRDSTESEESTEETRSQNAASALENNFDHVDYNYLNPFTSQYSDLYSSLNYDSYYDDLLKSGNDHKNSKETTDSDDTKVSANVSSKQDESGEKSKESKESKDPSTQNEVRRPGSKQSSDEIIEEAAGVPSSNAGDTYYDDNMYFDFLGGLLEKSRMNNNNQKIPSTVSNDEHQSSDERMENINKDDSQEDVPIRTDSRDDSSETQDSNGAIYTNPWATVQHNQREEPEDAMSQFFNFAATRNPMENGVIHGITNGFDGVMTTTRPIVPAADYYDDDEDSQRGRSLGFVGASDDQHGGISSLHNGHVQDNTYTHNQHFSLNNGNAHSGNIGGGMFSGNQNFGLFNHFEKTLTNIQQNIPSLNNDQSFSFSGFNQQTENGGSNNGHSQDFVRHIDGSVYNNGNFNDNQWPMQENNFQGDLNQNLHQIEPHQWNPHHTGNEQSLTESIPATENSLQTNSLSATGFDLLSSSPSATGSDLSTSISSHTSNDYLPSSSLTPQNSGSEHWSTGDMQASPIEASRQDRNIFLDPQTNYFSNSVHRSAFGAPNDQLDFNINFNNGNNQMIANQPTINNQPVSHDLQFYQDNNQFSVQSGNGASFGMVQNIPASSQQMHVTNEDSEERNDESFSGSHRSSLSSNVQPSNVYRNPYADDNFDDDHHESHQYANHNQERTNNHNDDENDDSSENNNENDDDTDR